MTKNANSDGGEAAAIKDRPGVIAPPPLIYLAFLVVGLAAGYFYPIGLFEGGLFEGGLFGGGGWRYGVGAVLAVLAVGLAVWALPQFRRAGTHVDPYKPDTAIITTGPYRFTRNPLYIGLALLYAGIAVAAASAWALVLLIPAMAVIRWGVIRREEAYLETKFGDDYRRYKAGVRRWF